MTQHTDVLSLIQKRRRIARRSRPYAMRRSKLERHRAAILSLKRDGASLGDIQYFLRAMAKPAINVERSTIKRFMDQYETLS